VARRHAAVPAKAIGRVNRLPAFTTEHSDLRPLFFSVCIGCLGFRPSPSLYIENLIAATTSKSTKAKMITRAATQPACPGVRFCGTALSGTASFASESDR
jgi:hypothetical protein